MPSRPSSAPASPPGFGVNRALPVGRHALLELFPGLDRLGPAERIASDPAVRARLFAETSVEIVEQDLWMYVAPWEVPAHRRGWQPVVAPGADCIVIGRKHLQESPEIILFLDIYHELCHVLQRQDGANLWEPGVGYVERRTEIDAYRFVVGEARALGVRDAYLREYLKVEWITPKEHQRLVTAVGVSLPERSRAARRPARSAGAGSGRRASVRRG
jgi:hypothetical protein